MPTKKPRMWMYLTLDEDLANAIIDLRATEPFKKCGLSEVVRQLLRKSMERDKKEA